MLVVSSIDNLELFEPMCSFFENFYLNNNYRDNKDIEIYHFSLNDITNISKYDIEDCHYNHIELPFPSKFSFTGKKYIFKAMGITSEYKDIKIYDSYFLEIGSGQSGPKKGQIKLFVYIIIIAGIIFVILVIAIIICIIRRRRKRANMIEDGKLIKDINTELMPN
jgi:hypothetical protein